MIARTSFPKVCNENRNLASMPEYREVNNEGIEEQFNVIEGLSGGITLFLKASTVNRCPKSHMHNSDRNCPRIGRSSHGLNVASFEG